MSRYGDVIFNSRTRELAFSDPVDVVIAHTVSEVVPALAHVAANVARGLHAAGFVAYEAAPAFDPALTCHAPSSTPLVWFGLYERLSNTGTDPSEAQRRRVCPCFADSGIGLPQESGLTPASDSETGLSRFSSETALSRFPFHVGAWRAQIAKHNYADAIARLHELIAAGDTYQANYTFPLAAAFKGDTLAWYRQLVRAQEADYCAFINADRFHILSASPELFFRLDGNTLTTKPMKGTRPRGRWLGEDESIRRELESAEKDRAENIMIVDLLRNDMGRISETNSVRVKSLFDVERYPTLWQMTSTITSQTRATVPEIFAALFPSGSVTGAPKIHTMQIIRELEPFPRGVYCGAIGWWAPDGQAEFSVAIRTAVIDAENGIAGYSVGSGITWDSVAEAEYEECLQKAAVLTHATPEFELLESILFDGAFFLLDEHLDRLSNSARYFDFHCDTNAIRNALTENVADWKSADGPLKIRALLARDGTLRIESAPAPPVKPVRLGFALSPIDDHDIFLFHKTTHRHTYETALASRGKSFVAPGLSAGRLGERANCDPISHAPQKAESHEFPSPDFCHGLQVSQPECDDVLLWNQRNEITESTTANLVLEIEGKKLTPPIKCGLLAGTFRAKLLAEGKIQEAVLTKDDIHRASAIHLINSIRQWIPVEFVHSKP